MIEFEEILEHLKYGEFYNLALGGPDCRGIAVKDYPMIASNVNVALIELYKRFDLKMNTVKIDLFDEITDYIIHSDYAKSNTESTMPQKWINDLAEMPYTDDLLLIRRVYNEIEEEFYLNDEHQELSLWTPEYNIVRHMWPQATNSIFVRYRAAPVKIPTKDLRPSKVRVPIPPSMLEALLWYVAGRVYTNLNPDGAFTESQLFTVKFEQSCQQITNLGLVNNPKSTNTKLDEAGWR